MPCFLIAEAGVNHNGRIESALEMVDVAADAGADAIKFQTFRADSVIRPGTEKAEYQKRNTGDGDQYDMIHALELGEDEHAQLAEHCLRRGIEFMSTPFDEWALRLLVRVGIRRLKVASGELTNRFFLERLAAERLPIVLSTGMASLAEVERSVGWLRSARPETPVAEWLTILHCTSNYPAEVADVNLRAMLTLGERFEVPVGYSDHSLGIEVSIAAAALGATVIEKHFTLDRDLPGPDHRASLDPRSLADLVRSVRNVESALGDGVKEPRPSEIAVRDLVRRSAFAARDLPGQTMLGSADLMFLRPGTGIGPERADELVGRRTSRALRGGEMLGWSDVD